jgi:hypothetical protein
MNLAYKLFLKTYPKKLGCLDPFYKVTVSELSKEARRQYCINLIGRLDHDLRQSNCQDEIREIRQYILAAKAELKKLSGQVTN